MIDRLSDEMGDLPADMSFGLGELPEELLGKTKRPLKINAQAQDCFLKQAAIQKENDAVATKDAISTREILPIARFIAESLMKGPNFGIIKAEVEKRFPDRSQIKAAIDFLNSNGNPGLLVAHLAAVPALYDSCEKCGQFLRENGIKVAAVSPTKNCGNCFHRKNAEDSCSLCSLIGARIMENGVSDGEVNRAIVELQAKGRLNSSQVRELKMNVDAEKRLHEAVRLSCGAEGRNRVEKSISISEAKDVPIPSAKDFSNRESATLWAINAISKTATLTQVRKSLRQKYSDADQIVNDAMAAVKTINADSLDNCLAEKYHIPSNPELVRSGKCQNCPHANDDLQCRRHGLVFAQEYKVDSSETPEAREILSFYADSDLLADIDPSTTKPSLDIQFWNPGRDLVVEAASAEGIGKVDDYNELFGHEEQIVEIDPARAGAPPLDVQGLGSGEGFDLSGLL